MKFIKNIILGMPIKYKISLIMMLILTLSIVLISNVLFNQEKEILTQEMVNRGKLLSENLSAAGFEAIINRDMLLSGDVIKKIMQGEGLVYAIIVNNKNRIIDSSLSQEEITDEIFKNYIEKYGDEIKEIEDVKTFNITYNENDVLDIARPVVIEAKNRKVKKGYVRIGMSQDIIKEAIKQAYKSIFIVSMIFILVGLIISFLFASSITNPVLKIVSVMDKVGEGDLSQSVKIGLTDEIGKLASSFNHMIQQLREKLMMSKYVSKQTMEMISKKEDTKLELGGEKKDVALFFSDIRGFTAFSENKTPEEVISMLNNYLSIQADIISKNDGSVDKFVGDEVVAVFEGSKMAVNAINSAIAIQQKIESLNKKGNTEIHVGIGIHHGEVVMGNMGSQNRMDYTVIGDNVNTTSRLCDKAERGKIIISDATYKDVKNKFKFGKTFELSVKGKTEPIKVYEVLY